MFLNDKFSILTNGEIKFSDIFPNYAPKQSKQTINKRFQKRKLQKFEIFPI